MYVYTTQPATEQQNTLAEIFSELCFFFPTEEEEEEEKDSNQRYKWPSFHIIYSSKITRDKGVEKREKKEEEEEQELFLRQIGLQLPP